MCSTTAASRASHLLPLSLGGTLRVRSRSLLSMFCHVLAIPRIMIRSVPGSFGRVRIRSASFVRIVSPS